MGKFILYYLLYHFDSNFQAKPLFTDEKKPISDFF